MQKVQSSFPNKQRFHIACENFIQVLKVNSDGFIDLIILYAIDILSIRVEIFPGDIEVFCSHDVHTFGHLESSDHEVLFVFVETVAFVSLVEMLKSFVELDSIVSLFPVHSIW